MQKRKAGRPSDGVPRKRFSLMLPVSDYWEIWQRAAKSGKTISHYIADTLLADWHWKKPTPTPSIKPRLCIVTELEKAIMSNHVENIRKVLSDDPGLSDEVFTSGRIKLVYEDNNGDR